MNVKILAICDKELSYAGRLAEAFGERKDLIFRVHAFSTEEQLEEFARKTVPEILLISDRQMSEKIRGLNIRKIILLTAKEVQETAEKEPMIYKYQSAEKIITQMLSHYAEDARPVEGVCGNGEKLEVIGVFSPIGRCGKTRMALSVGKRYAEKCKTLLLNFESYSDFGSRKEQEESWDLSDLVYFLRQGKKTFLYKLSSIVRSVGKLDYVLPMNSPIDLRSITAAEWKALLEQLTDCSSYQVVVIDFGYEINGIFELLEQCTKIYMPVLGDSVSRSKVERFEEVLRGNNFEMLLGKIQKVALPILSGRQETEIFMEKWAQRNIQADER